ncbi:hypothetical protein EV356DRAFT_98119 [Viridothelium virens]|uniref:Uncharacterized protein n=1 Tax=Viridothelium virens TaxID=1048519 RepID=A0A6A6HDD0_VIRVR|nr:hypothetical protein EV356DRAFT_98119 [Viridothelium virens]
MRISPAEAMMLKQEERELFQDMKSLREILHQRPLRPRMEFHLSRDRQQLREPQVGRHNERSTVHHIKDDRQHEHDSPGVEKETSHKRQPGAQSNLQIRIEMSNRGRPGECVGNEALCINCSDSRRKRFHATTNDGVSAEARQDERRRTRVASCR